MAFELHAPGDEFAVRDDRLGANVKLVDLLLAAAAVFVTVGVGLVFVPAGVVTAGVACGVAWWLLGETPATPKGRK